MKFVLLKSQRRRFFLHSGLLAFAVCLLFTSTSLAQLADTRIAFTSNRDVNWAAVYLMNPDGEQIRQLTDEPKYDGEPAWSPDGQKITFVSYRDLKRIPERGIFLGEIYLMSADGTNPINLTQSPGSPDGHSSWSPDGQQIAFTSAKLLNANLLASSDIWVMDIDGGNSRNLTNHNALDQTPDWSPDGNWITFSSDRDGNWEIYLMNADGTNPINLTNHPSKDGRPDWSPDGNRIAFSSDRDGNLEIYAMNPDGTNPVNLTQHPAQDNYPSWSPRGMWIAFESDRDGNFNWEIYVMETDGTNPINLTNSPAWDSAPSWGPAPTLSVTASKKLATLWAKIKRIN